MKLKIYFLLYFSLCLFSLKSQVPSTGLVLYLPLDGNAKDSSSFSNNGINYGATPVSNRFGQPNKAMYFNGTSRIEIPSSTSINLINNKSLSCWVYIPSNEKQNWYPTLILKDEPLYSATYNLQLNDYFGYSDDLIHKFDFYFASGYTHYQMVTKQLYTNYPNKWLHIVATYDTISGYSKMYFNGLISDSIYIGLKIANSSTLPLYIGCGKGGYTLNGTNRTFFKGYLDDIRLYNRAINKDEVYKLYMEETCSKSIKNDTTTYYVSSEDFQSLSPKFQYVKTDSLKTTVGGCDSIINHYAKFAYKANYCTITNSVSVTDTLIINVNLLGVLPVLSSSNILKIYPNPAKDHINIDFGDYSKMSDYLLVIRNELGKVVYFTSIMQQSASLDIKSWTGSGIYVVQLFDGQSNLVESRKIIIQ